MKKEIKIIALDLDGTTFNDDKIITAHTKEVIEEAISRGIEVLPCTGRQYSGLPKQFLDLKGVRYAITSNGAAIVDAKTGEPIYTNYIPYETAAHYMEVFLKKDILVDIYINGKCYIEESLTSKFERFASNELQLNYLKKTRIPVHNLPDFIRKNHMDAEKFHILFADPALRDSMRQEYLTNKDFKTTWALAHNMELNAKTADKGTAVLALADILGVPHEQTMACGDGYNDKPMLEKVGFSVAMENAEPEMKEICDFITKTNNEDGVAYAIETFVL